MAGPGADCGIGGAPLRVVIYPLNADQSAVSQAYLSTLRPEIFAPIAEFMREQAHDHGLALQAPIEIYLAPTVDSTPPQPPNARKHARDHVMEPAVAFLGMGPRSP